MPIFGVFQSMLVFVINFLTVYLIINSGTFSVWYIFIKNTKKKKINNFTIFKFVKIILKFV